MFVGAWAFSLVAESRGYSVVVVRELLIAVASLVEDFPGGSDGEASCLQNPGSIPGLGRSPGEGNGNPLQNYCLESPMDRGAWQATVHGVAKSRT